jgi:cytochrome c556
MKSWAVGVVVILSAAVAVASTHRARRPSVADPSPERLSAIARETLHGKMKNHGVDMQRLLDAVLHLDQATAKGIATEIANDDRLARPVDGDTALLNSAIPVRFFDLQDEQRAAARHVAEAATKGNNGDLAKAFGALTQNCVACHSVYFERK